MKILPGLNQYRAFLFFAGSREQLELLTGCMTTFSFVVYPFFSLIIRFLSPFLILANYGPILGKKGGCVWAIVVSQIVAFLAEIRRKRIGGKHSMLNVYFDSKFSRIWTCVRFGHVTVWI